MQLRFHGAIAFCEVDRMTPEQRRLAFDYVREQLKERSERAAKEEQSIAGALRSLGTARIGR